MDQQIKGIKVKDLVLWTENPRDPINSTAKDQDVVDRAVNDPHAKWELNKLAKEMGDYYDYSELPIVVYKEGKPIVYDGNRRVVLAKIKLGYVKGNGLSVILPNFPESLPCNVCSEDIALKSIYRKHVQLRNTWQPLERDIFASKYLGEDKSTFLRFDEATGGFITNHPEMNQGFVRKEILTDSILSKMGFELEGDKLHTRHSDEEVWILLDDIFQKVKNKKITTRINRGNPLLVLDQRSKEIIESNKQKPFHFYNPPVNNDELAKVEADIAPQQRKTPITRKKKQVFFGEKLILKSGDVNNLYSDILSLYNYVDSNTKAFSPKIYALFRMSLRLLCETAAADCGYTGKKAIDEYIEKFYPLAKKGLSQDIKTFLHEQNILQETLPQLFHTGAHNYQSSISSEKAMGISIILGAMLKESHGRQ
ncbi:MAG: hypothetical protein IJK43_08935 [Prevotella sp.]|nr:hypothetical protein [Prevotella sp.]